MESPSLGVCFLDTCMILNKILDEDNYRTNKFFDDMRVTGIDCYVSNSVKTECDNKINITMNYIGDTLRLIFQDALNHYFNKQGRNEDSKIVKDDLLLLERVLLGYYSNKVLRTPARNLENLIVNFIELKLRKGEEFTLKDIIFQLTHEIFIIGNNLKDKYDDFELMSSPNIYFSKENADSSETIKINRLSKSFHLDDARHMSSMLSYERKNKVKSVFVTSDYGILNNKIDLLNKFQIRCSNPLYAVHNF